MNKQTFFAILFSFLILATAAEAVTFEQTYSKDTATGQGVQIDWTTENTTANITTTEDFSITVFVLAIKEQDKTAKIEVSGSGKNIEDWIKEDDIMELTFGSTIKSTVKIKNEFVVDDKTAQIKVFLESTAKDITTTQRTKEIAGGAKKVTVLLLEKQPCKNTLIYLLDENNNFLAGRAIVDAVTVGQTIDVEVTLGVGKFLIPCGEQTLSVRPIIPGFKTEPVSFSLLPSPSIPLSLTASKTEVLLNDTIVFSVKDSNNLAVKEAAITMSGAASGQLTAGVDGTTAYNFTGLGTYKFIASKVGYNNSGELTITVKGTEIPELAISSLPEKPKVVIKFLVDNKEISDAKPGATVVVQVYNGTELLTSFSTIATLSIHDSKTNEEVKQNFNIENGVGAFASSKKLQGVYRVTTPEVKDFGETTSTVQVGKVSASSSFPSLPELSWYHILGGLLIVVGVAYLLRKPKSKLGFGSTSGAGEDVVSERVED